MNNDIKEILDNVKRHLDYVEATKQKSIRDNEMKVMYDYITNLQTIEQQYSAILSENAKLQEENKKYVEDNEKLRSANMQLFLRVGADKTQEEIKTSQVGEIEEDKEPRRFENLFDDKGNLK